MLVQKKVDFSTNQQADEATFLTFVVKEQTCALPIEQITRIIEMVTITQLPHTPPFIKGIINVGGEITLIIDLRLRFNLPVHPYGLHTPIILTEFNQRKLGLVVDMVREVSAINTTHIVEIRAITPIETIETEHLYLWQDYVTAVIKAEAALIPVLNLESLLSATDHDRLLQTVNQETEIS